MASHPAVAALRRSHTNLRTLVEPLSLEQLTGPSYDAGWTIADVVSHVGSGAVIGLLGLDAALATAPAPESAQYQAVWDEWNAKEPQAQAVDGLHADDALIAAYEAVDDEQLGELQFSLGPMSLDGPGMARMRLSELAMHTWDVAVALDPRAELDSAAVDQMIDTVAMVVGFAAKPVGGPREVVVETTAPERRFVLDVGESVALRPAILGDGPATVELPSAAFVRLVYGRLDAAHTAAGIENAELESLRPLFPGF